MTIAERRARRSRDELRNLLVETGRELLAEEGLQTGSSNLTFKRVFDRVELKTGERITNASVIRRVWEHQAEFQADVLVAVTRDQARPEAAATMEAMAAALSILDLSTAESRSDAVREVFRAGGNVNSSEIGESAVWPLWISVVAMSASAASPVERRRLSSSLSEGFDSVSRSWSDNFAVLMEVLGLRIRPNLTLEQFVSLVVALAQGCSLRTRTTDHNEMIVRPTGPNGEDQDWSLFALGLEALLHQFMEPDPGFSPPE